MNHFWLWSASAAVCNHAVRFGPNQPLSCSFLVKAGGQLGSRYCAWMKNHGRFPPKKQPKLWRPFLWSIFDFEGILQQSATMRTCDLGQISPGAARFLVKTGGQLDRKRCGLLKMPCAIPIPDFIILACKPIWLWNAFAAVYNHSHMWFEPEQPSNCPFFLQIWGSAWH